MPRLPGQATFGPAAQRPAEDAEGLLRRLDWHVVRKLDGLLQGDYRSLFLGHGYDLAEVREYQAEDDVRYMDWNVTARMDHPYVRQYMEDREITAWLLLDLSASVEFGTARERKLDVAVEFSALLARLLTRHGNKVGAMLFSHGLDETVPPRGGYVQALRLTHQLLRPDRRRRAGLTDLASVLDRAAETLRRRSLVFIVSDFFAEGWEGALARLAQRHEVVAVWLWDPREEEIPPLGPLILEDAETGEQLYVDTDDGGFQARFRALVAERREGLARLFARYGIDLLRLSTDGDLVRELVQFAHLRRESRRRASGRWTGVAG